MSDVWVLESGTQYEGGSADKVYGTYESGRAALVAAAAKLEQDWTDTWQYLQTEKSERESCRSLEEYLRAKWDEDTYYCGCDYVTLRRFELQGK